VILSAVKAASLQRYEPCLFSIPKIELLQTAKKRVISVQPEILRLTPWALKPFLVGVLSAATAIRKLPINSPYLF